MFLFCSAVTAKEKNDFIVPKNRQQLSSSQSQETIAEKNDFIVAKKKQRSSPSKLKEEIGDGYGRMLKKQAVIIERMAQANRTLVDRTRELLDDECNATLEQLQQYNKDLVVFETTLNKFESEACYMLDCLQTGLPVRSTKNQNKKDLT